MGGLKKYYFGKIKSLKVSDPDAQAFIDATLILDMSIANAINQLVIDLKAYNIWTKMQVLYPFVGGMAFTHKFNLKDPRDLDAAFRITFSGTITHNSNGITYGPSSSGNTNFSFFSNSVINDFHWSAYVNTTENIYVFDSGASSNGQMFNYISISGPKMLNDLYDNDGGNGRILGTVTTPSGNYLASRLTNPKHSIYKNGIFLASNNLTAGSFTLNRPIFLGNRNGAAGNFRFATIGKGLTDTEVSNLHTATQTFQTTLGRQV